MWRRASAKLLALRSVARPNRIVTASLSPATLRPSATIVNRHYSGNVSKRVEDVMPIATGHEREELEAELEGRDILDINFPEGPFGTKIRTCDTMAKALSSMLLKGFRSIESSRTAVSASGQFMQHGMRFSTGVPNDPDTHDDFKPKNKLENSEITLKNIVEQDVKENHVMIYMKGDPEQPRCGFSSLAVRVLSEYRVPIHSRNILEDPELKNAVKSYSMWPTFPQIFINGEFIGGSDIILNMHQNGELKEKIKAIPSE